MILLVSLETKENRSFDPTCKEQFQFIATFSDSNFRIEEGRLVKQE